MSTSSWSGAFQKVAAAHGVVTNLRKLMREYVEYCDANPGGGGCASTRKMDAFMLHHLGTGIREIAGVQRDAPLAVASPKNFRATKTIGCRGSNIFIRGMDLMAVVSTAGTLWPIGTRVIFEVLSLYSAVFAGTRVQWLANGFEKWKLKKLRFHYQPVCAATTGGALIMAWDNDPADPPVVQDISGIKELYSYESNVSAAVWQPMTLEAKLHPSTDSLFTSPEAGGDARLISAGSLQVYSTASPPINTGLGVIWIEYDIEFLAPSELLSAAIDRFFSASRNTSIAFNTTQALITQMSGGGFSSRGLTTQINPSTGLSNIVIPEGIWMADVWLNNQTTTVATGLTVAITTLRAPTSGTIVTVVGDCIDVAAPANNGAGLFTRVWVYVPTGGVCGVEATITVAATFSNSCIHVRDVSLGSAAYTPTQQEVGLYPY